MKKILLLLSLVYFGHLNAQICFLPVTNYTAGTHPISVVSVDFNSDGFLDLAIANFFSNKVSVLLGNGAGSFGTATSYTTSSNGSSPRCITSADFNNDGIKDLAVGNAGTNDVSVLLGTGTGTFGPANNFALGPYPCDIISKDFNSDGKADLAVAISGSNYIHVLLGIGTGGFVADTYFALGASGSSSVTGADFNGDAIIDLASTNSNGLSVLLGTGTGTFGAATVFSSISNPTSIINADFNGDSKVDLAVANGSSSPDSLSIFLGTGTGSFISSGSFTIGLNVFSITSTDFDGDTIADLAVANGGSGNVSIFSGNGSGSFGLTSNFAASGGPSSIISADFNGDGKSDLATANSDSNNVSILLNCFGSDVADFNNEQKVSIYPNPTRDQIFIDANGTDKLTVDLYDASGIHVYSKIINDKTKIDVTTLQEGIYTLTIKTADRVTNKKLVILR